jgi:hypothetical protein
LKIVLDSLVERKDIFLQIGRNWLALGLVPPELKDHPGYGSHISEPADLVKSSIEMPGTKRTLESGCHDHKAGPGS